MKKFLHIVSGAAKKALHTTAKLARKLLAIALDAACGALSCAGKALKKPLIKLREVLSPLLKITMLVTASVAALSCVGWLLLRRKNA